MKTKFFTGMGDDGTVHVADAKKKKSDICFHLLGLCDEVNVCVGHAACEACAVVKNHLHRIQELLFIAQADIASVIFDGKRNTIVTKHHIGEVEEMIYECDEKLPTIKTFIIPRGSEGALRIELARVRSREFERALIAMSDLHEVSDDLKKFSNRLSSILFVLARLENSYAGVEESSPQYK